MYVLLLLGTIFIAGGIGIYYLGRKRGVFNAELWALFPITHGLHEYMDFLIMKGFENTIFEQLEVAIAIASSIAVLSASIELLGAVPSPFGKLMGALSYVVSLYFVFISKIAFETMEAIVFHLGILHTTFFRLFFGLFLQLISISAIILSYLYLSLEAKKEKYSLQEDLKILTYGSIGLLLIFAIFEGFDSTNALFVTLRGISAIIFLLIPVFVIYTSKVGLEKLLIMSTDGNYLMGYDFNLQKQVSDVEDIMTASFISAINSFAQYEADIGNISAIKTQKGILLLVHSGKMIISLLTRTTSKLLENNLSKFSQEVEDIFPKKTPMDEINPRKAIELVEKYFKDLT